jgi:hypothetical protein
VRTKSVKATPRFEKISGGKSLWSRQVGAGMSALCWADLWCPFVFLGDGIGIVCVGCDRCGFSQSIKAEALRLTRSPQRTIKPC